MVAVTSNTSSSFIGNINPFRYRGYYYDTETGFYYLQTRYYDPSIMRFINADNYELVGLLSCVPGQVNMYAYANNNPIMYTDETGEGILTALLIGFLVGAGVSAISQGLTNGWNNINYLQAGMDGAFGALSVGLAATGIGIGASMAFGIGIGVTQYSVSSLAFGGEFSLDGVLFSGALGALGGLISGAGAQNAKGLADAILKNTSVTATGMISGIRGLTGNTAFSNVVTRALNEAIIKIGATTIGTAVLTNIRNFYLVD